jgi:hypothetical protein
MQITLFFIMQLLQSSATSFLLVGNILLITMFPNNLNPCSSRKVLQISLKYKIEGRITVSHIFVIKSLDIRMEDKF